MLKVRLSRDLRKTLLRGNPWVYRESIENPLGQQASCLCQVMDKKNQPLGWAIFCSQGPLALRMLSTAKKPPGKTFLEKRIQDALERRRHLKSQGTNAFRAVNGEGDGLPGFVCDIYGSVAVIQFDGPSCFEFWDQDWLAEFLLEQSFIDTVFLKPRRSDNIESKTWGRDLSDEPLMIKENGMNFFVDVINGQKTGFFLDQRDNRNYVASLSEGKRVLNLFCYTGGFSIYAGVGGASHVTSVDLAKPAIEMAKQSWQVNELQPSDHKAIAADVFEFLECELDSWDLVIVDPPSMGHSQKNKAQSLLAYKELFTQACKKVGPGKELIVSSCSSHVSFSDFFEIINESLSGARRSARVLRVSGQGEDHPFPQSCHELRYLKFVHLVLD